MFFWKNGLSKVLFLKNKYRIRFIHAILLPKKVLNICFQTFYFFSIPPTLIGLDWSERPDDADFGFRSVAPLLVVVPPRE